MTDTDRSRTMGEKNTIELEKALGSTHLNSFDAYVEENKESMMNSRDDFYTYMKDLFHEKGILQQTVFLMADIPERYGYKLLSGEKRTKQRDIILRICYAGKLTLDETQRALKKYGLPELYVKIQRDAFLMIMFNDRPGSIIDVNSLLKKKGFEALKTSGVQE
jgi:hypothetical protein